MAELLANSPTPGQRIAVGELASELTEAAKGAKALKLKAAIAKNTGLRAAGEARVIIDSEIIRITTVAAAETELEIIERGAEESTAAAHAAGTQVFCEPTVGSLNARYQLSGETAGGDLTGTYPNPTVGAEKITNAKIVAAAGIPESKLSLPEVVVKTGFQSITGEKEFALAKAERLTFYGAKELNGLANLALGGGTFTLSPTTNEPEKLRLGAEVAALRQVKLSGTIEKSTAFETEQDCVYQILPEGGAAVLESIKPGASPRHRVMLWVNVSTTDTLTIVHEGKGLAGERFFFASKENVKLGPKQTILLWYVEGEPTVQERWRDVGGWSLVMPRPSAEEGLERAAGNVFKVKALGITEALIAALAVSKGKLTTSVQEELQTVEAFPGTSAYTSAKEETETKPVYITAVVKTKAEEVAAKVKLEIDGKAETLEWFNKVAVKIPFSFLVKRAGKWKMTVEGSSESIVIARQAVSSI